MCRFILCMAALSASVPLAVPRTEAQPGGKLKKPTATPVELIKVKKDFPSDGSLFAKFFSWFK